MDSDNNFAVFGGLVVALCVLILVVSIGASLYADQEEDIDSVYSTVEYRQDFTGIVNVPEVLDTTSYDSPTVCFTKGLG